VLILSSFSEMCFITCKTFRTVPLREFFGSPKRSLNSHARFLIYLKVTYLHILFTVFSIKSRRFVWFRFVSQSSPLLPTHSRCGGCLFALHHTHTPQSVGLLWRRDRPVAETSTWRHKHSHGTNIHAPGGIRIHDPSKRLAADLRLRPCGHWDRPKPT
jgi:hypothetical protein